MDEIWWCILFIAVYIIIVVMIIRFGICRWNSTYPQQYEKVVDVNEEIDVTYPFFNRIYHYSRNQLEGVLLSSVNEQGPNFKYQIQSVDTQTTTDEEEEII